MRSRRKGGNPLVPSAALLSSASQPTYTCRPILNALGRKYPQYLDFAQQDAHEFMRILFDAMRMEEIDVLLPICSTWPSVLTTYPGNQEATIATSQ